MEMKKTKVKKDDGRYLIYYNFEEKETKVKEDEAEDENKVLRKE